MTDMFIGNNRSSQVTYDLMHLNQDPPGVIREESNRLHMRIDLAPLLPPVSTDLFRSTDKTAFERSGPGHIWSHESESSLNLPRIEGHIGRAEQFNFWCRLR